MAWRRRRSADQRLAAAVLDGVVRRPRVVRWLVIIALILLLIWSGWQLWQQHLRRQQQPSISTISPSIRIATWNLRKFSEGGEHPPDLVEIATIIKSAEFDVVAIQEVQREGQIVEKLRRQLNEPWRHVVSPRTGSNFERYAFLYRSDRVDIVDGSAMLLSGPEVAAFDRVPFVARFRAGQFDFALVTVHLSFTNVARRTEEVAALATICRELGGRLGEKDVIALGDFNEQRARGNLHMFEEQGWSRLNGEGTNLSSTEVYDNLLIDPLLTKEWTGKVGVWRFDELSFANDDRAAGELVSDHRPVWADFATAGPDDD
jgi:endonuclease/exonuclease/phosphatase family metal-dependent hydrolase